MIWACTRKSESIGEGELRKNTSWRHDDKSSRIGILREKIEARNRDIRELEKELDP